MITLVHCIHLLFICALVMFALQELGTALAAAWAARPHSASRLLLVGEGIARNKSHLVEGEICRIGRSADNDFVIEARQVAPHHLMIFHHRGQWLLKPLAGAHGVRLNQRPLNGAALALADGDRIAVAGGRIRLRVRGLAAGGPKGARP
jgi:pSer/pThr/pTyr-binding forkhead associated (FHA) protein